MNTGYRRHYQASGAGNPPGWLLLSAAFALALVLIGLPAIITGFFAQHYFSRLLSRFFSSWRMSFLLWLLLFLLSAITEWYLYQHGLERMIARELTDYVLAAKHYQADFTRWPLSTLLSDTLPVWLRTLPGIGIAGFLQELTTNARSDMARTLQQHEQRREHRLARSQRRARKRTSQPARLPDEAGNMMVIGVPIDDGQEEQE